MPQLQKTIFKAYDIRGIVGEGLTEDSVYHIGRGFGTVLARMGETKVNLSRDGRLSGPSLSAALKRGLMDCGLHVVDLGMNPTPMMYFACATTGVPSGLQLTGSHNPPNYNGIKIVCRNEAFFAESLQELYRLIEAEDYASGQGSESALDVTAAYIARITSDVKLARPMTVVCDTGNGVGGKVAPQLLRALGCKVIELFTEVDGTFPNHHPDPAEPHNLEDVMAELQRGTAEIGLAFDGDADRLGLVTKQGEIIWPDRQMMLFARDVLTRHPGAPIIFDVKCTALLAPWIRQYGGEPLMWRTGHSVLKAKLKETGAPLAGEMSGHIFFKDRWFGFDDALYVAARTLELLSREADPSEMLRRLPNTVSTPELKLECAEGEHFKLCQRLRERADAGLPQLFPSASKLFTLDGVRIDYADGFGLARPSNTTPVVVLRFEGSTAQALARIQGEFRAALLGLDPTLKLPF